MDASGGRRSVGQGTRSIQSCQRIRRGTGTEVWPYQVVNFVSPVICKILHINTTKHPKQQQAQITSEQLAYTSEN